MPGYDVNFLGASIGIVGFLLGAGALFLVGTLIQRWENKK